MSHFRWGFNKPNGQRQAPLGGSNIPCTRMPTTIRYQPCIVLLSCPLPYVPFLDERLSNLFRAIPSTGGRVHLSEQGFYIRRQLSRLASISNHKEALTLLHGPQNCHS